MKANELRIGCSFQLENSVLGGGIATIKNKYDLDVAFDLLESNLIKPIPLTEEWLLNLGFYKNIDTELFEKGGYQIDISVLKCHFYLPDYGDWYKEIEYVHELQNLYFALTEQELAVKLN
jgi:hypothetical protein